MLWAQAIAQGLRMYGDAARRRRVEDPHAPSGSDGVEVGGYELCANVLRHEDLILALMEMRHAAGSGCPHWHA
jgi:hypothetical protein